MTQGPRPGVKGQSDRNWKLVRGRCRTGLWRSCVTLTPTEFQGPPSPSTALLGSVLFILPGGGGWGPVVPKCVLMSQHLTLELLTVTFQCGVRVGGQRGSARDSFYPYFSQPNYRECTGDSGPPLDKASINSPTGHLRHFGFHCPVSQDLGDCPGFTERGFSSNNVLYSHISISGDGVR